MKENEAIRILGNTTLCTPLGQAAFVGIEAIKKLQQYRSIGTVEECQQAVNVRKDVTEIVNRQLIAGKNNYKETNDCFYEIAKVVQSNY